MMLVEWLEEQGKEEVGRPKRRRASFPHPYCQVWMPGWKACGPSGSVRLAAKEAGRVDSDGGVWREEKENCSFG